MRHRTLLRADLPPPPPEWLKGDFAHTPLDIRATKCQGVLSDNPTTRPQTECIGFFSFQERVPPKYFLTLKLVYNINKFAFNQAA